MTAFPIGVLSGAVAGLLLAHGMNAVAQDKSGQLGGWDIKAGPSLWGFAVTGDIGVGTMDGELDISFGDIIDHLNVALFVYSGR